ncbi:MAG: TIGR04053 family radical SAM/SPASM domain-containing protein [Chloroflexi bacterium]|nr:TIGR04053 family radical SAM/SPASM domain-containing protein [Chloroflexota bacterium]
MLLRAPCRAERKVGETSAQSAPRGVTADGQSPGAAAPGGAPAVVAGRTAGGGAAVPQPGGAAYFTVDFDQTPYTVAWEITRACALRCVHCRAVAQPRRDPQELTTAEGFAVIDQIVALGRPILVVTGGDPLMRRDVYDLVAYARAQGLRVALSPSATHLVTRERLTRAHEAGAEMVHLSLDGATAEVHDAFRGVHGSFQRTIEILRDALDLGLPVQIGTTVSWRNVADLEGIAAHVRAAGARVWSVFFLVPTGRAKAADMLDAEGHERTLHWLAEHAEGAPYHVRTTAAPNFRRVVIERQRAKAAVPAGERPTWMLTGAGYAFREGQAPVQKGVNDGKGFCFVDHRGNVCPSGFLQLAAGNVRERSLVELYREAPLFRELRDPSLLRGKCGRCPFRDVCGGSRARAYAVTGDYLAADPSCVYQPA